MSWLLRSLATRNINARPPRKGATTALSLNVTWGVGREKRENRIPVTSAKPIRPTSASSAETRLAAKPFGLRAP